MISQQAIVFLESIGVGAFLTFIFDIFRAFRKVFRTPNYIVWIQDFFFILIALITIILTTFLFNNGDLRGYMIFGYFIGLMGYLLFLSKIVILIFSGVLKSIARLFLLIYKMIQKSIQKMKRILKFSKKKQDFS